MKNLIGFMLLVLVASTAQAAPAADCKVHGFDNDGDKYCQADPARPAPVDPTALAAYNLGLGPIDCNDNTYSVHPDALEIVGDGVDQDCSCDPAVANTCPGDLTFATHDDVAHKFGCNPKNVQCMTILEAEFDACQSAGATQCEVNTDKGRFGLKHGFKFLDKDCDGVREVLTQADYDDYVHEKRSDYRNPNWEPRPDGRCGTSGGLGGGGGGGASAKALNKQTDRVDENDAALKVLRDADNAIVVRLDDHDETLKKLRIELNGEDGEGGMHEEIRNTDRKFELVRVTLEGDDGSGGLIQIVKDVGKKANQGVIDAAAAQGTADDATFIARMALARGMTLHGVVGTGILFQGAMPLTGRNGNNLGNARGNYGTELRLGIDIGYALPESRAYASARFNPISEEAPDGENDFGIAYEAGIAYEFGLTANSLLGGHLTYSEHESGGDVLGSNALSRGVFVGPSLTHVLGADDSAFETALNVRFSVGYESYGADGNGFSPSTDGGFVYGLTFEVKPGIGPVL